MSINLYIYGHDINTLEAVSRAPKKSKTHTSLALNSIFIS